VSAALDHLVVLADSLEQGAAWCEAQLGVRPGPGGEHPLMGTHNRLLRIDSADFPQAYLEIIAIQPGRQPQRTAPLRRWFDMDDAALQARLRTHGPQLGHWVARTDALEAALATCRAHGWDRGPALAASRMTAQGLLQWRISVREDGQRLLDGALPTLIAWGAVHPSDDHARQWPAAAGADRAAPASAGPASLGRRPRPAGRALARRPARATGPAVHAARAGAARITGVTGGGGGAAHNRRPWERSTLCATARPRLAKTTTTV